MERERSLIYELGGFLILIFGVCGAWLFWGPGYAFLSDGVIAAQNKIGLLADAYQKTADGPTRLVAPLISLLSGAYAIYIAVAYAERRLQKRLQDFLTREEKRLTGAREQLRLILERPGPGRTFESPVFLIEPLDRAVRELGWGSYFLPAQLPYVDHQLDRSLERLGKQIGLSKARTSKLEDQLKLAHLLKGARLTATGVQEKRKGGNDRLHNISALKHFEEILRLDKDDLDGLEYASHMRVRLGQYSEANVHLVRILTHTADKQKSLPRARALRYQAEISSNGDSPPRYGVASKRLREALVALPNLQGPDWIEEAELNEALADARIRLRAFRKAHANLEIAQAIYAQINSIEAKEGVSRVEGKLAKFTDQEIDDDDNDDEPIDPVVSTSSPLH